MKNAILPLAVAVSALLWTSGCKKDEEAPTADLGYAYFPTDTGRWVDFTVDTVWRNDLNGVTDSLRYSLREKITEDFTDPEGRPAQRMIRYRQDSASGNWVPKDVWWQVRGNTQAERTEENQRRIKLIFPPRTGQYWNTNALNTEHDYELTYMEVDVPWSVNGMSFDSTLLVKTTYPNNAVITNTYFERYAKHIGLIYREADSTNTQTTGEFPNVITRVRGTWYKQVVTGYGH